MDAIPLIRASAILPFVNFLNQIGTPTERLLKQTKVPIFALENPQALIPLYQTFDFGVKAARTEGIDNLGLVVGQRTQPTDTGLFGKILSQSLTLYDLLNTIVLMISTHNSGLRMWVTEENNQVWLHHQFINPSNYENQQSQYFACVMYSKAIQLATGLDWHPTELHVQANKLKSLTNFELFSDTHVSFNQPNNAISFPKSLLIRRLKHPGECDLSQQQQDCALLKTSAPALNFTVSLRQLLQSLLRDGYPHVEMVAEIVGMSTRSLQRRLAGDGLSYSRLVDQVRFNLAADLLKEPSIHLLEIAFELGYTDAANFTRAFRRWTGKTPSQFRALSNWEDLSGSVLEMSHC